MTVLEALLGAVREKLVEQLQPQRDTSRAPLFQVMFSLQNMPLPELALGSLTLSPLELDSGIAKFDLSLFMQETSRGLRGFLRTRPPYVDCAAGAALDPTAAQSCPLPVYVEIAPPGRLPR